MGSTDIKRLFEPRSVAVIGASHSKDKIGFKILQNIISSGFSGNVYPINPKGGTILGMEVYADIAEVPEHVDIACVAIPEKYVFDAVRSCADSGVSFVPIITSGFSEVGNIEEERKIVEYARSKGTRVLGPNIFGVYSARASINATFGPDKIKEGGVAIITQSGALGLAMIGRTSVENIGLSAIVSVGNKADIEESELLEYLVSQRETKAILIYMEGVQDGERLISVLQEASKKKPIILIKSGRSKKGAIAVASHTGSLAGSDQVFDSIMKQCGVIRAENIDDAFSWCKTFVSSPPAKGRNTVIVTNGGGIGVMAADACEKYGVALYEDSIDLKKTFSHVTPSFGSTKNPVDITGQAVAKDYDSALSAALENKSIDSVVALYCETAVFDSAKLSPMIRRNCKAYADAGKPLIFAIFGGEAIERSLADARKDTLPVFSDVYTSISCLGAMERYMANKKRPVSIPEPVDIDFDRIASIAESARKRGMRFLSADYARKIMAVAGIDVPKSKVAEDMGQAVAYAEEIGYPIVMKVVSEDILHKSDVGGVKLDLRNRDEVIDAYQAILASCKRNLPDARIRGVEIVEMAPEGTEIIIGARKDRSFGPVVMCGLGGIYVEVMQDVSFRSAHLNREDITHMIKEIKSYPILLGARGKEKRDIDMLVHSVAKIAAIIRSCPQIEDIEVNPLSVYEQGKGVCAVDVRILLSNNKEDNSNG